MLPDHQSAATAGSMLTESNEVDQSAQVLNQPDLSPSSARQSQDGRELSGSDQPASIRGMLLAFLARYNEFYLSLSPPKRVLFVIVGLALYPITFFFFFIYTRSCLCWSLLQLASGRYPARGSSSG